MPTVTVLPAGGEIELQPGESLMRGAHRLGYWWPTVCGGHARCGACISRVVEGMQDAGLVNEAEQKVIDQFQLGAPAAENMRLACQLVPTADLVVFKARVRPEDSRIGNTF
jgi:2Fe-2S ferredoxin